MLQKVLNLNHYQNSLNIILYILAGSIVGFVSWGHGYYYAIFSLALFFAYLKLPKRVYLFCFVLFYYLTSSRGLLIGVMHYYSSFKIAFTIWISAALISSIVWATIWHKKSKNRYFLLIIVIVLITIPPVGFINWVNPIITAGILFPGTKWSGFVSHIKIQSAIFK